MSYLRISIGASDLNSFPYSYDDLAAGQMDPLLQRFSLDEDRRHLIPALHEIAAAVNETGGSLTLLGSPWSAPAWMKDNTGTIGGSLQPQWQTAYAQYLVRYVTAMRDEEGIVIDAITVQNEPLNPDNNPSMFMAAADQAAFIRDHLGPAFRAAGLSTKIICYDHNADRVDYPIDVLSDKGAYPFVHGSAFHLYAGSIENVTRVLEKFPEKVSAGRTTAPGWRLTDRPCACRRCTSPNNGRRPAQTLAATCGGTRRT